MLIDAPPTLLKAIIHKKHLSHFMAKSMNELAHKSPLILVIENQQNTLCCVPCLKTEHKYPQSCFLLSAKFSFYYIKLKALHGREKEYGGRK